MTDQTLRTGRNADAASPSATEAGGIFDRDLDGVFRTMAEDFRAVPLEAWIILAVSVVMSNLFIALA